MKPIYSTNFRTQFQKETELNFEAVCFLKKEYRTGPVVDSLTKKEKLDEELKPFPPYCKYIHGQIEELNKEVEKNIKRRDEEYEIWVGFSPEFHKMGCGC